MALVPYVVPDFWESLEGQYPVREPAVLSATQNDYDLDLAGGSTAFDRTRFKLKASAAISITGFVAASADKAVVIENAGTFDITLEHQHAGSAAANRITVAAGSDLVLAPGDRVALVYDDTAEEWMTAAERPADGFRLNVGSTATAWTVLLLNALYWTIKHLSIDTAAAARNETVWMRRGVSVPDTSHDVDTAARRASVPIYDGETVLYVPRRETVGVSLLAAANTVNVLVEPNARAGDKAH